MIGGAVGGIVNGGTWKSVAIGVGVGLAAGEIAKGAIDPIWGQGVYKTAMEAGFEEVTKRAFATAVTGVASGVISSVIYGQNIEKNLAMGAAVGAISAAVLAAAVSHAQSVTKEMGDQQIYPDALANKDISEDDMKWLATHMDIERELEVAKYMAEFWKLNASAGERNFTKLGNKGYRLGTRFGGEYHCGQQGNDLCDFLNSDFVGLKYYHAEVLSGEGYNSKGFIETIFALAYDSHTVVKMWAGPIALEHGFKDFTIDGYVNLWQTIGGDRGPIKIGTVEEFQERYPINQLTHEPWDSK